MDIGRFALAPEDSENTALLSLLISLGRFECIVMPFSLCKAAERYQPDQMAFIPMPDWMHGRHADVHIEVKYGRMKSFGSSIKICVTYQHLHIYS